MAGVGQLIDSEPLLGAANDASQSKGFGVGAILDDETEQERARARQTAAVAVKTPPEQAGRARQLVDATGLPPGVVDRNADAVAQMARLREINDAIQVSPVLRRQMADPEFAKIAQDDTKPLSTLDEIVRFPWKMTQAVASGLPSIAGGAYGVLAAPFELSSQLSGTDDTALAGRIGKYLRERATSLDTYASRVSDVPKDAGIIQRSIASGFQSIGQNLPGLIAAMYTGNAGFALGPMAASTGGQSYAKARDAGLTPLRAAAHGIEDAFWEYTTELLPTTRLLGDMKAGSSFIKTFMRNQVGEQLGEQAATALQDFDEWVNLHPDRTFADYLQDRPSAALQTAIATVIGSGGQVTIMKAMQANAENTGRTASATHDAAALQKILEASGLSALRERSPTTFANFVNEAAADGPVPAVYVDAQTFAQSAAQAGIDIARTMPETAAALQDAIDTKSDVRIPIGEFAAAIPGTTLEQALVPLLRTSVDGATLQETQDKKWIEDTQAQTEKILADHVFNEQWKEMTATVENELYTQLDQAQRFTKEVNRAYAGFMSAFYATQAARLGITPEQMYVKYPLQIRAQSVDSGATLGQANLPALAPIPPSASGVPALTLDQVPAHLELSGFTPEQVKAVEGHLRAVDEYANKLSGGKTPSIFTKADIQEAIDTVVKAPAARLRIGASKLLRQPAYHGSPHDIGPEGFSTSKIGTGEGANAYGWGLYFAENPSVAAGYYRQLADNPFIREMRIGSMRLGSANNFDYTKRAGESDIENIRASLAEDLLINENALHAVGPGGFQAHVLKVLDDKIEQYKDEWTEGMKAAQTLRTMLEKPGAVSIAFDKSTGGVYQVDIPDDQVAKMLLWDKPLSQQPENVKAAIEAAGASVNDGVTLDERKATAVALINKLRKVKGTAKWVGEALNEIEADVNKQSSAQGVYVAIKDIAMGLGIDEDSKLFKRYADETQDVLSKLADFRARDGGKFYEELVTQALRYDGNPVNAIFKTLGKGANQQEAASKYLMQLGVPGIKYLDAGSRGGPLDTEGTHNLVVFDDKIIKLTHKDGSPVTQAERNEYLQPAQGGERGSITLNGDIKKNTPIITLLPNADLSTFLHESGHFYLEVLADMASQPDAPQAIQDDMAKVLKWFGVPDLATWNAMTLDQKRESHEKFARGFEAYLFEGKAPSTELNGVFARFRAWLINVYKQVRALNVEVSDEVRGVMDRLIATNEEIIAAETARNYAPLFATKPPGMSDAEWIAYHELGSDATQEAVDQLQTRSVRDMQFASNARSRAIKELQKQAAAKRAEVRAEVEAEVKAEPIYRAREFFLHGVETEETAPHLLPASKLDAAAIDAMYTPGVMDVPDLTKLKGMTAKEGISPDMAAELFGFGSGDELIRKLADAEPMNEKIAGITDQRMLERYGDLADPQAIERAASEAVHNEVRARFVATEMNALNKATNPREDTGRVNAKGAKVTRAILPQAAKQYAAELIARKKIKDVRPNTYAAAETRAARAAEAAVKKNDLLTAAAEKRNQLVNLYATKASYDALNEVEKGVRYLKKLDGNASIDADYRDQIEQILERFDLRAPGTRKADVKRKTLAQWVEQQQDLGFDPVVAAELIDSNMAQHYATLTVEEFRGIVDTVKNIEHLGRLKKKLLTAKDQREFDAIVDEAAQSIVDNAKRTVEQKLEHNTWADKMKSGFAEFFAMHRKFASLVREMDGYSDTGALWKLLTRPMNEAGNREAVMREQATIQLEKLFKPIFDSGKMHTKVFIPAINASLSREGRIMVALNTGNDGNLQRLTDGDKWTMPQVQAVIDTLTKEEMDFVQAVWDYVGSFKKEIGEQQRRLTGVAPEWVEPRQVITNHGVYRGGYIPAKYDTTRSTRSLSDEAAAGLLDAWRAKRGAAKTRDSFTKDRANKVVDRPLRKDFGVITQHITEVTHRLAWQEFLVDANRLMRASKIDGAIREHYGPEVLKAMRDALEDVAAGEVGAQNAFERGVNYLRTGATIAGLGWRITTSLLQPIGLTQSMVRIGPKYVGRGLAEWLGDSVKMENTAKRIYEKSDFMRLRGKTMQREISEIQNQIKGKSSAIEASYFYLIQKMQLAADIPTWLGQYHKAVEGGADEATAIAQADQAVIDAQGGGQIKDLAAIQRGGPMLKLFTNFYSFFNTTYNLTSEAVGRTNFKNPLSVGRLAVDMLLLYSVPAVMGTLLKAVLHSGDKDQDEKKLIRQLISDQLTYLFGTMVGLRELAGAVQTTAGLPGDYQGPASVRVFAEIAKLGKQVGQGEVDEALLKALDNVGGILFHYPAGQINATADGLATMAQGKTSNPGALLVGSDR